jgi:hypothetical protein
MMREFDGARAGSGPRRCADPHKAFTSSCLWRRWTMGPETAPGLLVDKVAPRKEVHEEGSPLANPDIPVEERRRAPRRPLALAIRLDDPGDAFARELGFGPSLPNLVTTDVAPGGVRLRAFHPLPFAVGDRLAFRMDVPHDRSEREIDPEFRLGASLLGRAVTGRAEVVRIRRIAEEGVPGFEVALRFVDPVDVREALA